VRFHCEKLWIEENIPDISVGAYPFGPMDKYQSGRRGRDCYTGRLGLGET
jgi:hypothetical protein